MREAERKLFYMPWWLQIKIHDQPMRKMHQNSFVNTGAKFGPDVRHVVGGR